MSESKASRTLVKSTPELWSEVSTAASLQRHMDQFGEIRITKLEPETAVAWEGENARGTITLESSGWGTKVSLTAETVGQGTGDAEVTGRMEPGDTDVVGQLGPGDADVVGQPRLDPTDRVDPQPDPTHGADPEPAEATSIDLPPEVAETEMRELKPAVEDDKRGGEVDKPRWTRRLALAFNGWFRPRPLQDAEPAGAAPLRPSEPEQPVSVSAPPAPVASEPEQPATPPPVAAVELAPQPEATPSELETVPTAALDAALNSLGQAHHRPYSRS